MSKYVEFNPHVATECGLNPAIVLEAVAKLGDDATVANIVDECPYLGRSGKTVRSSLRKLESYGYVKGEFFGMPCRGRRYELTESGSRVCVGGALA